MNNYIREKAELLKKVHNLILTGAPGTGKTYLAQQIAKVPKKMLTFAPSYLTI